MAQTVKCLLWETWVRSLGREDSPERKRQPSPVLLPRKSLGWRSLAGYSPQGRRESNTTERLHKKLRGEIGNNTIMVKDFSTTLS